MTDKPVENCPTCGSYNQVIKLNALGYPSDDAECSNSWHDAVSVPQLQTCEKCLATFIEGTHGCGSGITENNQVQKAEEAMMGD